MNNDIATEKTEMGIVPLSQAGHRIYVTIVNNTPNDIVIMDRGGFAQIIKPNRYKEQNNIKIIRQTHDGDFESLNEDLAKYDTTITTIKRSAVEKTGGIYVESEDILICSSGNADCLKHPYASMSFDDVISNRVEESLLLTGKITFIANDPIGRYSNLYANIMGYCIEIECTNFADVEPMLTCRLKNNTENYVLINDNINDIFEKEVMSFQVHDTVITVGVSKELVITEAAKISQNKLVLSRDDLQKRLDDYKAEINKNHDIDIEEKNTKIEDLKLQIDKLNNTISELRLSIERKEFLIEKYEARDDYDREKIKKELIRENLEYKRDEQIHKSHRASVSAGTETIKAMGTATKVVVGIAIGAAATAITMMSGGSSSLALLALI